MFLENIVKPKRVTRFAYIVLVRHQKNSQNGNPFAILFKSLNATTPKTEVRIKEEVVTSSFARLLILALPRLILS